MSATLAPTGVTPMTTISIRLPAGNYNEGEKTWIADLTAALLADGSHDLTGEQLAQSAADMGGRLQTRVTPSETIVTITVLSTSGPAAIALLARVIRDPAFPDATLEREKRNLGRTLAWAAAQPAYQAEAALGAAYYGPAHPYGRVLPASDQLASYGTEDVRAFHRARYTPDAARIYVGGQFDNAQMQAAIEQAFAGWLARDFEPRIVPKAIPRLRVALVDRPGATQTSIKLAYPAPTIDDPDDIAMRALNALLSGSASSRIMQNIRGDKGYAYRLNSGIAYRDRTQASWVLTTDVNAVTTGAALTEIFREIDLIRESAPSPAETAQLQALMSGNFLLQSSTPAGLIDAMAQSDLLGLPDEWIEGYVPRIAAIDGAAIRDVAVKYLDPTLPTLVIVGDLATVREQLSTVPALAAAEVLVLTP